MTSVNSDKRWIGLHGPHSRITWIKSELMATVSISANRTERSVVFTVTDAGPGMPPEVRDKAFDMFESHSQGSRHRGAGLGLSLVRSFVKLHGGEVRFAPPAGKGTTVICEFPLQQAVQRDAAE